MLPLKNFAMVAIERELRAQDLRLVNRMTGAVESPREIGNGALPTLLDELSVLYAVEEDE